jgi:tRNA dimethylallyltransferase
MPPVTSRSQPAQAILIAGPTASGKSAAALALARETDGVIVNADSMQLYRELRVLTARPSAEEEAAAPHRLYGYVSVKEPFSVAKWLDAASRVLSDLRAAGTLGIVVGGTGLYFSALERGLSPIPEIDPDVRSEARSRHARLGNEAFHAALAERDPRTAGQLRAGDAQRVIRAWEVLEQTGQGLAEWQEIKGEPAIDLATTARIALLPEREQLYRRCDMRFHVMMKQGALDEARAVNDLGLDASLPATRALGLRQLVRHLAGEMSLEQAVDEAKRETRRFAKRQLTWFRHQMKDWELAEELTLDRLRSALDGR